MTKKYSVTMHAVERAQERLGLKGTVSNTLCQYMMRAVFKGNDGNGDIYDNYSKNARIIVKDDVIVTVYPLDTVKKDGNEITVKTATAVSITVDRIANAVKREFKRMQREVRTEVRKLSEQAAELHVQAAQLNVNKIRCRAPHTQALIQTRIDAILSHADEIAMDIDAKLTQMKQAETEVKSVVSGQ